MSRRSVVVVGGGLAGLTAARSLALAGDHEVTVIESANRLGGKLTRSWFGSGADALGLDAGAESMLARRPEGTELIAELGLGERQVQPTGASAQVLIEGEVRALPPSAMGVPTDLDALRGYLSPDGLARARCEPELPSGVSTGQPVAPDIGIGALVAERFGDEVTDRLLEPLLGGVYAGRSRELSFAAVNRPLWERARTGGSLLAAARELTRDRPAAAAGQPVFAGLEGGVTGLTDALTEDLRRRGVPIRTGTPVRMVWPRASGGYVLEVGPATSPELVDADLLVLAAPAAAASRLLFEVAPEAAIELAEIPYASVAVLTLIVGGAELSGSGLLVPPGELPTVKALTYAHNKWAWVAESAERHFGEPVGVVRASVGRFREAAVLQLPDQTLLERTVAELTGAPGPSGGSGGTGVPGWTGARVLDARVQRWGGGLPQYLVGHPARVERIRAAISALPGLAVCGGYLDGPGLPACIATGRRAATDVLAR